MTPFEHVHHVPKKCDSELVAPEVFAFYKGYAFGRLREWKDLNKIRIAAWKRLRVSDVPSNSAGGPFWGG